MERMSEEPPAPTSGFLVGHAFDSVFFLYSPLIALCLGVGVAQVPALTETSLQVDGRGISPVNLFIGSMIAAHLVLVFARSHANRAVFARHPLRFLLVPPLLFCAFYGSFWAAMVASALATWWDLYHSSMQTFGLARLYERKAGNDVQAARSLDKWLNLLLYIGPVLAGATLVDHLRSFENLDQVGLGQAFFSAIPARVQSVSRLLTWAVVGVGVPFLAYYVYAHVRLARAGHRVSPQKVFLLVATGVTSIYTWGFNSFGQAFFIMNFFHAWQYFAIVWWTENGNLKRVLRLEGRRLATPLLLLAFVALPAGYGLLVTASHITTNSALFCLALVVALMHFWYDGFIWSVRAAHV